MLFFLLLFFFFFLRNNNQSRLLGLFLWVWAVAFYLGSLKSLFLGLLIFLLYAGGVLVLFFFLLSVDSTMVWNENPIWLFVLCLPLTTSYPSYIFEYSLMTSLTNYFLLIFLGLAVFCCLALFQPSLSSSIRN